MISKLSWKPLLLLFVVFGLAVAGCGKDPDDPENPDNPNEAEVITTLTLTLTDSADASNVVVATFEDPDGEGGNGPTQFDDINLDANRTYNVAVSLLNESDPNDVENIGDEVAQEADEHRFCYAVSGAAVSVNITDTDNNNLPLGLESKWRTAAASSGTVTVSLKHQPGTKDGSCSPGDTDIEVQFNCTVQ